MSTCSSEADAAEHSHKNSAKTTSELIGSGQVGGNKTVWNPRGHRHKGNLCRCFFPDLRGCSQKRVVRVMGKHPGSSGWERGRAATVRKA